MNDTLDVINKLMRLALNNPNDEEARSAALHAIKLISKYKVPVGDIIAEKPPEYQAPSEDFYQTVKDIFEGQQRQQSEGNSSRPAPDGNFSEGGYVGPGLVIVDRDLSDENPIRRQIILAWRAIRESRAKLELAWQEMNKRKYGFDRGDRG